MGVHWTRRQQQAFEYSQAWHQAWHMAAEAVKTKGARDRLARPSKLLAEF
jgi:hypothetical protein